MTEEAVSIAIPDDDAAIVKTTGADDGAVVIAKTPPAKTETPPELADMKRQLEEAKAREATERTGRTEAERVAREQAEARGRAETQVADSRVASVTSAIEAEEAKASKAERDYADAMAAGDFTAASKANRQMSDASARLVQLGTTKAELEASPKREPTHEGAVRATPRDPVEELASRSSAPSAAWIRSHRDIVLSRGKALSAAHSAAVDLDGTSVDTPEYFAAVEKHLGIGVSKVETDDPPRQDAPRRQAVTTSAPVGAGHSSSPRASQDGMVHLSAAERDMARSLYPDLTDKNVDRAGVSDAERTYARNKQALIREGKLTAA